MRNAILATALLFSLAAVAQTGTNSGNSQELQKPRTGRNDQVITSPDINAAITGTMGTTTGQPPDVAGPTTAIAGAASAASITTGDVSTRDTMERQRLMALVGKTQPPTQPEPPSPPFIASSSQQGKAINGHNEAETSRLAGLQQGPATDNGAPWAKNQNQGQSQAQPQPQQRTPARPPKKTH
jgi:hypothetical protein